MRELSQAELSRIRRMVADRCHPQKIDDYLTELGYTTEQIDQIYYQLNYRWSHQLSCYRMKQNVRFIGVIIALSSVAVSSIGGGLVIVFSFSGLVYGIAVAITGNLTVVEPMGRRPI